jgi:serine/threonine protein phosphatase PrpC
MVARGMLLAKKLRLAVASQTDVGRRRERNQDNLAHLVPSDERVLAEKGAIFIVCDGMGGHAAGEVAAELGVTAIRDEYIATDATDVITSLANAVKRANESIYQYARDHAEMTGMGTTCVTLVIHGGRGYFLNIGDSRAYLVRNGVMRQITQDHSWVGEQVRAGLLTDEQARTHAHRNVITRSLGTQPTVTADLFIETLADGDRVLLCSDGLHGYVDEAAIEREMLEHTEPDEGVQHLVDMANANGGPDNITALVVHLLEVPEAGELRLPGDDDMPEQISTQPIPAVRPPRAQSKTTLPRAPLRKRAGRRPAVAALRLLAVLALIVLAAGIWDAAFGPYALGRAAATRLRQDITQAQEAATAAPNEDPGQALAALAQARARLVADLQNPQLDDASRQLGQQTLDSDLAPAVRGSLARYDATALIQPLALSGAVVYPLSCNVASQAAPQTPADLSTLQAVAPATSSSAMQTLYALGDGTLYAITVPLDADGTPAAAAAACNQVALPTGTTPVALASQGATLYALVRDAASAYAVVAVQPAGENADGTLKVKLTPRVAVATPHGEQPVALALSGTTVFVGFQGATSGVWAYNGANPKAPAFAATLPQAPVALAATNGTVYLLLSDGSLGQLDSAHAYLPLPLSVPAPITDAAPEEYTSATPVPTAPAAGGATATLFATGATLGVDPTAPQSVLVGDGTNNRVVRLAAAAGRPGLTLAGQYVYGPPLAPARGLALAGSATVPTAYLWSAGQLVGVPLPTGAAS